jgi:hypothetical protein
MTLESQLRSIDAAAGQPDDRRAARGSSLVERIVHETPVKSAPSRAKVAWRLGGLVAAGAAVAVGAVVLPILSPELPAVASWTPEAGPVSRTDLAVAEEACRGQLAGYNREINADTPVVLAERRGDLVGLVLWEPSPESQGMCLVELPEGSSSVAGVSSSYGGSSGDALQAPPGEFTEGAMSQFRAEDGNVSMTSGSAGENVVGVRLHADGLTTEATVADGRFVAWWPGAAFADTDQPSGKGGPSDIVTYDLIMADGSVVSDADPWFPSD